MLKIRKIIGLLLLCSSLVAFSGCGSGEQKNKEAEVNAVDTESLEAYRLEQKELLDNANAKLSSLNKKIIELNDKIKEKGSKLTDEQNNAIDTFEKKRASVNQRIHQIKNVSYNDWKTFKAKFEADMDDCCADIDKLLAEL